MTVLHAPPVVEGHDTASPAQAEEEAIERSLAELRKLELPAEDGIPMETNWHRSAMNLLIDSVHALWHDRTDYFSGGNMFIYFSMEQVRRKSYRGPDFFVVKGVDGTRNRDSWVIWEEDGRYPDVIVELASPSTIQTDLQVKKQLYEQTFHTAEYFCYDPNSQQLWGWRLSENHYREISPNDQNWLWSQELEVWLGLWEGEFQRISALWLRFYRADSQLVLTKAETAEQRAETAEQRAETAEQRAEAEQKRAERLAAQLQAMGVDPEKVK